jgi:hypothetical protein
LYIEGLPDEKLGESLRDSAHHHLGETCHSNPLLQARRAADLEFLGETLFGGWRKEEGER